MNLAAPRIINASSHPSKPQDVRQLAEQVLHNAEAIGCRKYLTPSSIVSGNPRLNLAFVTNPINISSPLTNNKPRVMAPWKMFTQMAGARQTWNGPTQPHKKANLRPIRSFNDPAITTGLNLLDTTKPGIMDPTLVINVNDSGAYQDRPQNEADFLGATASLFGQLDAFILPMRAGKVTIQGSIVNVTHMLNEDEDEIQESHQYGHQNNSDIRNWFSIPASTMQLFDE
ncbi:hypothetical protein EDB19DRAFT_1830945 [Suillus lakei]|nr:hypothetical protein EDB19DRAFT_1830945 [Suillus lakei]